MENLGTKRNEWIEAVRVFAMLLIIMFHMPSSYLPNAYGDSLSSMILFFLFQPQASLTVFFFLARKLILSINSLSILSPTKIIYNIPI